MTKIDQIDQKILRELSEDGRLSNMELANRVGLSASACSRRVQDLERRKIIRGYRAIIDPAYTGGGFTAYVGVGLSDHSKESQEGFEVAISKAPEVLECHNVTGLIEYLLRVEVPDLASYKVFHTDILGSIPGVNSITSYIVLESAKDKRA